MRKLIVSMNLTLDGFMAGPNCELDWHFKYWNEEMGDVLAAELYKADCLLFGRLTYCGMMRHWQSLAGDTSLARSDLGFFTRLADCPKVVYSNTLQKATWKNSTLIKGDFKKQLTQLKKKSGKNILVYGSGQLVSSLLQLDLVDELRLFLHPVLLQKGKPFYRQQDSQRELELKESRSFHTGVLFLSYAYK